jgi:hypothetical protein
VGKVGRSAEMGRTKPGLLLIGASIPACDLSNRTSHTLSGSHAIQTYDDGGVTGGDSIGKSAH